MGTENYFLTLWSVSVHAVCVCVCVWGGGVACHMMCLLSIPVATISAHCVCVSLPVFFCLLSVSADLSRFVLALYLSF